MEKGKASEEENVSQARFARQKGRWGKSNNKTLSQGINATEQLKEGEGFAKTPAQEVPERQVYLQRVRAGRCNPALPDIAWARLEGKATKSTSPAVLWAPCKALPHSTGPTELLYPEHLPQLPMQLLCC